MISSLFVHIAIWAPSAHNKQPWRFAVLQDACQKENLANAMGNKLRFDRTNDGDDPEITIEGIPRFVCPIALRAAVTALLTFSTIPAHTFNFPNITYPKFLSCVIS